MHSVFHFGGHVFFTILVLTLESLANPTNHTSVLFTRRDASLAQRFVRSLKRYNGEWASHGIQRIIRLNNECSNSYVSLRNYRIMADVPVNEAFTDPYTLIEQQIYRKATALKSKQTNKYVCFNKQRGNFILKSIDQLDKYCIFFYSIRAQNLYTFSIGSTQSIFLSFSKFGRSINARVRRKFHSCPDTTNVFGLHSKSTDNVRLNAAMAPVVIVYEREKPIKSYSLRNGYRNLFYSTLEQNLVTTTTFATTTTITARQTTITTQVYNLYEYLSRTSEAQMRRRISMNRLKNLRQRRKRRRRRKPMTEMRVTENFEQPRNFFY